MTPGTLFASIPVAAADGRNFLPLLYLAAALVVGAVVIVLVGRWRKGEARLTPTASDELAQYRALYERGAISEEEYRKLRSILGGELRKGLDLAPRPLAPSPPPPAAGHDVQAQQQPQQQPPRDEPPATGIKPPE